MRLAGNQFQGFEAKGSTPRRRRVPVVKLFDVCVVGDMSVSTQCHLTNLVHCSKGHRGSESVGGIRRIASESMIVTESCLIYFATKIM